MLPPSFTTSYPYLKIGPSCNELVSQQALQSTKSFLFISHIYSISFPGKHFLFDNIKPWSSWLLALANESLPGSLNLEVFVSLNQLINFRFFDDTYPYPSTTPNPNIEGRLISRAKITNCHLTDFDGV